MDWLIGNAQLIFTCVTLALVAGVWGYATYWRDRARLRRDLEGLVEVGLESLKQWAKDRLDGVTTDDIREVSNWLYDHYVAGTDLAKLVTRERLYALLLEAFVCWRERFVGVAQAMAAYSVAASVAARKRR